jgi:hypothetical protein
MKYFIVVNTLIYDDNPPFEMGAACIEITLSLIQKVRYLNNIVKQAKKDGMNGLEICLRDTSPVFGNTPDGDAPCLNAQVRVTDSYNDGFDPDECASADCLQISVFPRSFMWKGYCQETNIPIETSLIPISLLEEIESEIKKGNT